VSTNQFLISVSIIFKVKRNKSKEDEYVKLSDKSASVNNTHANVEVPKPFMYSKKTEYGR